jgi:hypothetical protein
MGRDLSGQTGTPAPRICSVSSRMWSAVSVPEVADPGRLGVERHAKHSGVIAIPRRHRLEITVLPEIVVEMTTT